MTELLWGSRPQPRRGPKPALTLEGIATAAIAVADTEGLAAISMQRVAGELGYTKMSLYRYVPGKAELVAVMTDLAIGEPPQLDQDADWAGQLAQWAERLFVGFGAHPWLLETTAGPRLVGPNELGWLERALAPLGDTALSAAERLDAVTVITGHVRTIAQQSLAAGPQQRPEEQLTSAMTQVLAEHGERYPAVLAALGAVDPAEQNQAMAFGLRCILSGLRQLMAERAVGNG
ncbi:TetR/AcrR family transcriptional regulator [Kitasatospora azatica]|uniref:TetR/AcrR family transcriptional regulator n=1 Tax=Kitasatospora azatica TaxID=58347 RepID=UPI000691AC22|nr:TetR/AcrR family transcriptional regulator C-terminal domain-containing protein [Kitasatospora azatica]